MNAQAVAQKNLNLKPECDFAYNGKTNKKKIQLNLENNLYRSSKHRKKTCGPIHTHAGIKCICKLRQFVFKPLLI